MPVKDGDFGFIGPEDTTENPYQDRQKLMNWFVELSVDQSAKTPKSLLGAPGLIQVASVAVAPPGPPADVWTFDNQLITFDNALVTFDGAHPAGT